MSTHSYNPVTINAKLMGTVLNLFIKTGNLMATIPELLTLLPLGGIWLDININQKLVTINAKSMGMILNLLGVILLAIDINRKLVTINAKLMGTILNLFIKTGTTRLQSCDYQCH